MSLSQRFLGCSLAVMSLVAISSLAYADVVPNPSSLIPTATVSVPAAPSVSPNPTGALKQAADDKVSNLSAKGNTKVTSATSKATAVIVGSTAPIGIGTTLSKQPSALPTLPHIPALPPGSNSTR